MNVSSEMKPLFMVLYLNVRRGSSEEIWPLRGFFTVSLLLVDFHVDKILLFLTCQECQKCIENLESLIMKVRVAEINVNQNLRDIN